MGLLESTHIMSLRTFCRRYLEVERRAFRQRVDRCILVNVTILLTNGQHPKLKIDYSPFQFILPEPHKGSSFHTLLADPLRDIQYQTRWKMNTCRININIE